jgi:hypothetical protein
MPAKPQRHMMDEASRQIAEANETFLEMLPTLRRKDLERLIEKRPALWGRFAGYLTSGHVFVDDPGAGARRHATKKKTAFQLDREIAEFLAQGKPQSGPRAHELAGLLSRRDAAKAREINAIVRAADGRNVYLIRSRLGHQTVHRITQARVRGRILEVRGLDTASWLTVMPELGDTIEVR